MINLTELIYSIKDETPAMIQLINHMANNGVKMIRVEQNGIVRFGQNAISFLMEDFDEFDDYDCSLQYKSLSDKVYDCELTYVETGGGYSHSYFTFVHIDVADRNRRYIEEITKLAKQYALDVSNYQAWLKDDRMLLRD